MDENKILEILQMYIQEEMSKNDGSHDWWHVRRVYNNAMLINEKKKEILLLWELLHYFMIYMIINIVMEVLNLI